MTTTAFKVSEDPDPVKDSETWAKDYLEKCVKAVWHLPSREEVGRWWPLARPEELDRIYDEMKGKQDDHGDDAEEVGLA